MFLVCFSVISRATLGLLEPNNFQEKSTLVTDHLRFIFIINSTLALSWIIVY